jgi:hypothetical protein
VQSLEAHIRESLSHGALTRLPSIVRTIPFEKTDIRFLVPKVGVSSF